MADFTTAAEINTLATNEKKLLLNTLSDRQDTKVTLHLQIFLPDYHCRGKSARFYQVYRGVWFHRQGHLLALHQKAACLKPSRGRRGHLVNLKYPGQIFKSGSSKRKGYFLIAESYIHGGRDHLLGISK